MCFTFKVILVFLWKWISTLLAIIHLFYFRICIGTAICKIKLWLHRKWSRNLLADLHFFYIKICIDTASGVDNMFFCLLGKTLYPLEVNQYTPSSPPFYIRLNIDSIYCMCFIFKVRLWSHMKWISAILVGHSFYIRICIDTVGGVDYMCFIFEVIFCFHWKWIGTFFADHLVYRCTDTTAGVGYMYFIFEVRLRLHWKRISILLADHLFYIGICIDTVAGVDYIYISSSR